MKLGSLQLEKDRKMDAQKRKAGPMCTAKQWAAILGALLGGIGGYLGAGIGGAILGCTFGSLATLMLANFFAGVVLPAFITSAIIVAIAWLAKSFWNVG